MEERIVRKSRIRKDMRRELCLLIFWNMKLLEVVEYILDRNYL